jgi:hypothetical protein
MKRISPETKERYRALRRGGLSQSQAARECVISKASAHDLDYQLPAGVYNTAQLRRRVRGIPPPLAYADLSSQARRGLEDFDFFCEHFLARERVPWRKKAADAFVALLEEPEKSWAVLNAPPGPGKSTLLRDATTWLVARDRAIRVLLGAETLVRASEHLVAIRRLFESEQPFYDHVRKVQAEGVLALSYGRFRPLE